MAMFVKIDNAEAVIILPNGTYKEVDLYKYDGLIFCKNGSGFIGLNRDKTTTSIGTNWRQIKGIKIKGKFKLEV